MSEKHDIEGSDVADSVSATLPGAPDRIGENLEAAAEEYCNLKAVMDELLHKLDPSRLEQPRKVVDDFGEMLGVSMDAPLAAMGEMAGDLKDRIVQIRCFLQSILAQNPAPDYGHFLETYKNILEPSLRKIYDENDINGRLTLLKEKVRGAFADCKTLADCNKTIKELATDDSNISLGEYPAFGQRPMSDGVRLWLTDREGCPRARKLSGQEIDRACLATVPLSQGEVKILGFDDVNIKHGFVLHAGLNLALIERISEEHGWFQSSGDGVHHQHSTTSLVG